MINTIRGTNMNKCKYCGRYEFKSLKSYKAHVSKCKHNPDKTHYTTNSPEANAKISKTLKDRAIAKYAQDPKRCKACQHAIDYRDRTKLYCSKECRRLFCNKDKKHSAETKNKIRQSRLKQYYWKKSLNQQYKNTIHPYSKLVNCNCAHCKTKFYSPTRKKYCNKHSILYGANNRNKYVFTFNIYHYPELFDLNFIESHKWRCSKTNPNGVTRDHRLSINDAIRNNYDPYYIKHPLNCELMLFNENNKKKTSSSITYNDLVKIVNAFDQKC